MIISEDFQVCEEALEDVFAWLSAGGEVAVFDATNTTRLAFLIHRLGLIGYWGLLVALTRLNYLYHSEKNAQSQDGGNLINFPIGKEESYSTQRW